MKARLALALLVMGVAACNGETSDSSNDSADAEEPVVASATEAPVEVDAPTSAPNYDEREGDVYMYVAAVSEEDRKTGKVAGDVVMFRYLGVTNGVHRLENVTETGARIDVADCASPCKVIRVTRPNGTTRRLGYNVSSIIGGAFEDAFAGRLEVSKGTRANSSATVAAGSERSVIPSPFVGEWNTNLEHCGTGLNDSRLRVEPGRLRFYESDAEVTDVTIQNSRAIVIKASYVGEGETWTDQVQMVLSRSGADLTIDGFTRHRCP